MEPLFLLRYDTEYSIKWGMKGFFERVVDIHSKYEIPATFFCKGAAISVRKKEFQTFWNSIQSNQLFDVQDHSFSHIDLGYVNGSPLNRIQKDYLHSFEIHEQLFGKRPIGVALCGVRRKGPRVKGFDATNKSRSEFEILAKLGVKMVDTFLSNRDGGTEFITYDALNHPEIMGFPSKYSDTGWLMRKQFGDPMNYILQELKQKWEKKEHFPLILHDWITWQKAPDKNLTHVIKIVEKARELGFKIVNHQWCYEHINQILS